MPRPRAKTVVKTASGTAALILLISLISLTPLIPNFLANTFAQPEETLAQGKFLVAANNLRDSNFSETVIYLVSYSTHGAMGVVVNRPTDVHLARALPHLADQPHAQDVIYAGGPVGRSHMIVLIRSNTLSLEDTVAVTEEISASSGLEHLALLAKEAAAQFRVHAGYAGWSPGQLDNEVARGDWYILPGDAETLFSTDPASLWPALIQRGAIEWTRLFQDKTVADLWWGACLSESKRICLSCRNLRPFLDLFRLA